MTDTFEQAHDEDASEAPVWGIAIWGVLVAVSVIYVIAFPIRIQIWITREINNQLYFVEDREWMPVREVWWTFLREAPVFGTQFLVQLLIAVSAVGTFVASLWLLRLVLTQEPEQMNDA